MLCQQEGVLSGSDFYFFTPSPTAKKQLFYFTSVGHFVCDLGYKVSRKNYDNYLLLLVKKGRLSIRTEGAVYTAKEGDAAFINCHTEHEYHAMGYVDFLWVHFDGSNTEMFHQDITKNIYPHPVFHLEDGKTLERKLNTVVYNQRYEKLCTEYEESLQIYELLIELTFGFTGKWKDLNNPKDQLVEEAVRYIGENLQKDLSVRKIADHVGLSESHFNRKFRQALGSSPKEYIIRKRLNEAKHLLKTTSIPVKEIAVRVGFNSESHFTNTFTAQNGISPRKFREFPI